MYGTRGDKYGRVEPAQNFRCGLVSLIKFRLMSVIYFEPCLYYTPGLSASRTFFLKFFRIFQRIIAQQKIIYEDIRQS